jgi:hypothetical protein
MMGFRFRRSISILPGVRLNVSKSGGSVSLGGRGATVNVGRRGAYADVGLPGSGLSYRQKISGRGQSVGFGRSITIIFLAVTFLYFLGRFVR